MNNHSIISKKNVEMLTRRQILTNELTDLRHQLDMTKKKEKELEDSIQNVTIMLKYMEAERYKWLLGSI